MSEAGFNVVDVLFGVGQAFRENSGGQTVDRVVAADKISDRPKERCRTANEPLLTREETDGVSGILPPKLERRVVEHYCANEWAVHLEDVMLRRTGWHYYFADSSSRAEEVAEWMAEIMGWSNPIRANEIERYVSTTKSDLHAQ